MPTTEVTEANLSVAIDDDVLAELLGDEASVSRLIEEEVDPTQLPSALSVLVLTAVAHC